MERKSLCPHFESLQSTQWFFAKSDYKVYFFAKSINIQNSRKAATIQSEVVSKVFWVTEFDLDVRLVRSILAFEMNPYF